MSDKDNSLTLDVVKKAVAGRAAAFRCVTEYQPVGGAGDKVFPPTYQGGRYAEETRTINGESIKCVLLDSVQSQANRMELALLEAVRANRIQLPLMAVSFDQEGLGKTITVTSLEAPHRVADAIFRDSLLKLTREELPKSRIGKILEKADARNAAGLFQICPTALLFGLWDSTGPRGGLGAKFQRAIVSEIVGINAVAGVRPSSRLDPLGIQKRSGPVFRTADNSWTLNPEEAVKVNGKPALYGRTKKGELVPYDPQKDQELGNPSKINHGNIPPSLDNPDTRQPYPGGFTISKATQITVLSLAALRRLRFPLDGAAPSDPEVDNKARTVLAALGLCAAALNREEGGDLRSRCQLFPVQSFLWELLDTPGQSPIEYRLDGTAAEQLFNDALSEARKAGLPWDGKIELVPTDKLFQLVKRSQDLVKEQTVGEDE